MKLFKRVTSAVTAFLMLATVPAVPFADVNLFSVPAISAVSTAKVAVSVENISLTETDFTALKTVADYSECQEDGSVYDGIKALSDRKVVEVPVVVTDNAGFAGLELNFEVSEGIAIVGCRQTNGYDTLKEFSFNENFSSGEANKITLFQNQVKDTTETGTVAVLLCALPAEYKAGDAYDISVPRIIARDSELSVISSAAVNGTVTFGEEAAVTTTPAPVVTTEVTTTTPAVTTTEAITEIEDTTPHDYTVKISKEIYKLDDLKTLADYDGKYMVTVASKNITAEHLDNKVAEVVLSFKDNIGVNSAKINLDYDSNIIFAGCSYGDDGKVSLMDGVFENEFNVSAKYNRILVSHESGKNIEGTGDLIKLLFVLPDDVKNGDKFNISVNADTSQFVAWNPDPDASKGAIGGYILVSDKDIDVPSETTPAVTTTEAITTTPAVTTTEAITTTPVITTAPVITTTEAITTTPVITTTEAITTTPVATTTEATTTTTIATTTEATTTTPVATTTEATTTTPVATTTEATTTTPVATTTEATTTTPVVTTTEVTTTTPVVTTPSKPVIDIVLDAGDKLKQEILDPDEKIELEENASIELKLPEFKVFKGQKTVDVTFDLTGFDADKAYFDYAGFGITLPEGITVAEGSLKTDLRGKTGYIAPGSTNAILLNAATGINPNGGYVALRGVDTRNLGENPNLFTITLNIADSVKDGLYKIEVATVYGRITDKTVVTEDSVTPYVALISTGTDKQYTVTDTSLFIGLKGDVNLDHKITQIDATLIMREVLALGFDESILAENINTKEYGENAVKYSYFLGDVDDSSEGKTFEQMDATYIMRAILEAGFEEKDITLEYWKEFLPKK